MIDGALVARMNSNDPLEPQPFIARTREEILEASRSKYCPVPVNILIKDVLKEDERYTFVGLPCHIHGLERFNRHARCAPIEQSLHMTCAI